MRRGPVEARKLGRRSLICGTGGAISGMRLPGDRRSHDAISFQSRASLDRWNEVIGGRRVLDDVIGAARAFRVRLACGLDFSFGLSAAGSSG